MVRAAANNLAIRTVFPYMDPETIERARGGGDALEALIAEAWPSAYRVALVVLRDRDLAQDAAQEACVALTRSLDSLRTPASFAAWMHRIAVRCALDAARARARHASLEALADREVVSDSAQAIDLYHALASLSPVQRAVVFLHYFAGLRSHEIAAAIGVLPPTVRFHLMRARRRLRAALDAPAHAPISCNEVVSNAD